MRLVYLTLGFPYPLTSGRLRHYHLMKHLRGRADIKLVCAAPKRPDEETRHALQEIVGEVQHVDSGGLQQESRAERAAAKRELGKVIAASAEAFRADAIFAMAGLPLESLPLKRWPLAIDFCDAEWFKASEKARLAPFWKSLRMRVWAWRTKRYEQALARSADHAFFAAARDARLVMGNINVPHTVLPNGVDTEFWQRRKAQLGDQTILFAGAFSYQPNVDAALFLAREVLPRIQAGALDVRLVLAGRDPPEAIKSLHDPPRLEVTGFVPDFRDCYEQATVFLAPLRIAGGIQNKLLEALAMEVPVVTTSKGVEGLGLSAVDRGGDCALAVCDAPEEIAQATLQAMARHGTSGTPVAANRELVAARFSWERGAQTLANVMERLIAARQ